MLSSEATLTLAAIVIAAAVIVVSTDGEIAAGEAHPLPDQSLSAVLSTVERHGYMPVTEAKLDDGRWELEAFDHDLPIEIEADVNSGAILRKLPDDHRTRPDSGAKPLSAIVRQLEAAGYALIFEADYDRTGWKIEAVHAGQLRDLLVDAVNGKVLSDLPAR